MKSLKVSLAILTLVIALMWLMRVTFAQEPTLILEMTVAQPGRTIFRCFAPDDLQSEAVDCSGNAMQVKCDGETTVVDRIDNSSACFIAEGTELDEETLDQAQEETQRSLLAAE